ncbi:SH3 domain-containing protein [Streptomyces althioticus]|uniref:SH3 domain-containing protein n=1 Tax=Streptomyces althioticus TaxID=83380 RepID=UPI0037BDB381
MSLRRPRPPLTRRLPIALAAGALTVATAVAPAFAADDPGQGHQNQSGQSNQGNSQSGQSNQGDSQSGQGNWDQQGGTGNTTGSGNGNSNHTGSGNNTGSHQQSGSNQGSSQGGDWGNQAGGNHGDQGRYRGVVTAQKLALRSAPNRGSQVIRYAHKGDVVSIFCKVPGDHVDGNPLWYLLTDGTWAWGPARYIDNIGPAPRWC